MINTRRVNIQAQRPRPSDNAALAMDGTIVSRSINWENNIHFEALVIFKKTQFALGLPNGYEFNSGAKKKNERQ